MTRQWLDQARKAGQIPSPNAADGTFAAGVNHVTELLPSFMTDILNTCPDEQKVRSLETLMNITIVTLDCIAEDEPVRMMCIAGASSRIFLSRIPYILYSETHVLHAS